MLCPVCRVELRIAERSGIEIDYCPQCRGVWLDRGELDKIIERSTAAAYPREHGHHGDDDDDHWSPHRKRKSFWRDLFDFD